MDEAMLTGETYPVEKTLAISPADAPLSRRGDALFMGTHVVSGSAEAVVVHTGKATEFGQVSERLGLRPPETEFERGVRRFGYLLMEVTVFLVIAILVINVYLNRPVLDSLLFSLALAVGLTPQLLPAIISINLSYGAKRLAERKVIVKRLASIENFGSMNVLCCDKTGTLTEGKVRWQSALSVDGQESHKARLYAYLNAFYESGFGNPIDEAIRSDAPSDISAYRKLDEVPYDFVRKRQSILVGHDGASLMIAKGALQNMLAICSKAETADGTSVDIPSVSEGIQRRFEELSAQGLRVLGLAYRELTVDAITRDHESSMTFLGFLVFFDPPKAGVADTIRGLRALGINMKIITGDNRLVATTLAQELGLRSDKVMTGAQLRQTGDEALVRQVSNTDIFAETEPNQKERIIQALKHAGNVVGFMGDGINDASALHAADVGISVDTAVDVAKETADIVLLEKNLDVLLQGVKVGRATFANTLKYVFMATSANFGNMFSMAGASLFLKFLPLLPQQVLLNNLMTDIPEMTIATDSVDPELVDVPHRWNVAFIRRFMIVFGLLSTLFDFATFGVLLYVLHATTDQFRAGWFAESVVSASLVVLVIRSRRPFFKSKPGRYLAAAPLVIGMIAVALPFTPIGKAFGFHPFPAVFLAYLLAIVTLYILMAEVLKRWFYSWNGSR
ncbi:MAG: magnesium-translocating P-type ATPase, partial [Chloroflexi bacterium]|nr:magnesium-translocating P-type ATPase [Chloroflexota bacterium]